MRTTLTFLILVLSFSTHTQAESNCREAIYKLINDKKVVFNSLRPDDWVSIKFQNGQDFEGMFKYIKENSVVFKDTNYQIQEFKTDHVLKAKIELIYRDSLE